MGRLDQESGKLVGPHRIRIASVAYSIFFAGSFFLIGFALGDVIRAL
jgi:hypothetical protein